MFYAVAGPCFLTGDGKHVRAPSDLLLDWDYVLARTPMDEHQGSQRMLVDYRETIETHPNGTISTIELRLVNDNNL